MIAGYILTGGKNRRMNGKKKLFLEYQGIPFYQHILQAFQGVPIVYLSVERTLPYEMLSLPMVVDIYAEIGPIGGIYSGLKQCKEEALFVTACDTPFIERTAVETLIKYYESKQCTTVVQIENRLHPLFGIYPKSVLPMLEKMIQEKNYRMMDLLKRIEVSVVQFDKNSGIDENINTVKEYDKLKGKSDGTKIESL